MLGSATYHAPEVGIPTAIAYHTVKRALKPWIEKATGKLDSLATDAVIYSLIKNEAAGVPNAIHWANKVLQGAKQTSTALDAIFKGINQQMAGPTSDELARQCDAVKEFIKEGQLTQQLQDEIGDMQSPAAFAKGGMVGAPVDQFSKLYPEQNMLLNSAKGRVANYLNSIRPLDNQPKLPFDRVAPEKDKNRQYDQAVRIAVNPSQVLGSVMKGNLTPDDMKHFTNMYPEVYRFYSKEMTKRILQTQLKKEKPPPYKTRQAMSLFLGAPLDSTFTPQAIMAAQSIYAPKQQPMPQSAPKKSTASLSKLAPSALTNEQARIRRQQNQKA